MFSARLSLQERRSIAEKPPQEAAECFSRAEKLRNLLQGAHSEDIRVPGIDGTLSVRRLDLGAFRGWVIEHDKKGIFIRENGETLSYSEFKKKAGDKFHRAGIEGDIPRDQVQTIERNLHRNNIVFNQQALTMVYSQISSTGEKLTAPSLRGNGTVTAQINNRGNLVISDMPAQSGNLAFKIEVTSNGTIAQGRIGERVGDKIEPYDRKPGYKDLELLLNSITGTVKKSS